MKQIEIDILRLLEAGVNPVSAQSGQLLNKGYTAAQIDAACRNLHDEELATGRESVRRHIRPIFVLNKIEPEGKEALAEISD